MAVSYVDPQSDENNPFDHHAVGSAFAVAAALAPLVPVFAFSYLVFLFARDQAGLHPLFAGGIAMSVATYSLFLLKVSKAVRYLYFSAEAVAFSLLAFLYVLPHAEMLVSSIVAVLALLAGLTFAFFASNFEEFRPER